MDIKIDAVGGISMTDQCQIIKDYLQISDGPVETKKGTGTKIQSCGRRYHVGCHETETMWVFRIWWGV
jgi:hypothetical protein